MSDKVVLAKKVADAIDAMRAKGLRDGEIVAKHIKGLHVQVNGVEHVEKMHLDFLIQALYIGYEVEETPEEKVKKYYQEQKQRVELRDGTDHTSTHAIRTVLKLLGIKIEGVDE